MSEQKQDEGMSAEIEKQWREHANEYSEGHRTILHGEDIQKIFSEIDRLRAANAALKGKVGAFELWMDTASKSGFVFATGRDGFEITHDPPLCREILAIRVEDAEQQIAALTKERDDAQAIPGLPVGMRIIGIKALEYPNNFCATCGDSVKMHEGNGPCSVDKCECQQFSRTKSTYHYSATLAPLEDEAPPDPPKMVCVLCGFPAKYCEDEKLWRHVPSNGIICDKYGYPIDVKPEANAKGVSAEPLGCCEPKNGKHVLLNSKVCECGATMDEAAQAQPQFTDEGVLQVWRDSELPDAEAHILAFARALNQLPPKPRESVTLRELQKTVKHRVHLVDIRAILAAVRASDGTMKDVED